jgi:hypothetical protein
MWAYSGRGCNNKGLEVLSFEAQHKRQEPSSGVPHKRQAGWIYVWQPLDVINGLGEFHLIIEYIVTPVPTFKLTYRDER